MRDDNPPAMHRYIIGAIVLLIVACALLAPLLVHLK